MAADLNKWLIEQVHIETVHFGDISARCCHVSNPQRINWVTAGKERRTCFVTTLKPESIEFIDQLEKNELVKWETIIAMVERLNNRIDEPTSLGHVFHTDTETVFIEFYFEMRPKREYLIDYMQIISSDRYLDLILEDRKIILTKEKQRWVR